MINSFISDARQIIEEAGSRGTNLVIKGHNTKSFYGNPRVTPYVNLDTVKNNGVIDYDPSELVVRVRSGTSILDLEKELI